MTSDGRVTPSESVLLPTASDAPSATLDPLGAAHAVQMELRISSQCDQFGAVVRKNCVVKRRAWFQTCVEIVSAPLLLCILFIARSISDIEYYDAVVYANQSFPIEEILNSFLVRRGDDGGLDG